MSDPIHRAPTGTQDRTVEQNTAAGGRAKRMVNLSNGGSATASISLRRFAGRAGVYAYLRWRSAGEDRTRYVGVVTSKTRHEALAAAWAEVRRRGLLHP
jgi:DNA mismatch endonuclease (patch repair protein)